jgi:transcriptional regulator with XRE-family HTH domain
MAHKKNPQLAAAIGERIRELRKEAGISSQDELAARAQVDRTYIGRLERGETGVTLASLALILEALSVSLSEFFGPFDNPVGSMPSRQRSTTGRDSRSGR